MQSPPDFLSAASVVRRYYGVWLVYSLAGGFLAGVYPLFLRSRGLNQFEINSVLAMYFAVTFLLDAPVEWSPDPDLRGIPFAWKMAGTLSLLAVPCYLALRPRPDLAAPRRTLP
jgi:hypothetical protein